MLEGSVNLDELEKLLELVDYYKIIKYEGRKEDRKMLKVINICRK